MPQIQSVVVIYNPNSTGSAKADALAFCKKIRAAGVPAKAVPTKRAGHANTLARSFAERPTPTMIVSASGDGGYNEVINGVLHSTNPRAVTGVLPSGNANDHYHSIHHGDTARRIVRGAIDEIDVLSLTYNGRTHYAHSYIGLGLTPQIGQALTNERPNRLQEIWLVLQHLGKVRPVKIRLNGKTRRYDHLVFSNTQRMSKVLKINSGRMNDGKFEIIGTRQGSLTQLLGYLFRAASRGVAPKERTDRCEFTVLRRDIPAQLDGEVITLKKGSHVTIASEHKLLRTIV